MADSGPGSGPGRTWREGVQKDCWACNLNREDAADHGGWGRLMETG